MGLDSIRKKDHHQPRELGQAKLPLPESATLVVDPLPYKVAQVLDENDILDKYMTKVGVSIKGQVT